MRIGRGMKTRTSLAILAFGFVLAAGHVASAQVLRVLVTNDDGIAAAGIDALVEALVTNPNLELHIIAPAANSSGTGESRTNPPATIQVTAATTLSGRAAKSVAGFPGDTALWGIIQDLAGTPPDLVVSGINFGQNLSAEIIPVSGTVGAATWAARLGIPAIAVSAGLAASPNYAQAAVYAARLVEEFRVRHIFRKKMVERDPPFRGVVLNVNFPTCATGTVRGVRVVAVGRSSNVTAYTLVSDIAGVQTWLATLQNGNFLATDCTATSGDPLTDLEGFNHGFATVTPLDPERNSTGRRVREFRFLERFF